MVFRVMKCLFKHGSEINNFCLKQGPGGGGLLLGVLDGGVPPCSSNPHPISDQKMSFYTPVFRPGPGCSNVR